jgi:hypothetical protein
MLLRWSASNCEVGTDAERELRQGEPHAPICAGLCPWLSVLAPGRKRVTVTAWIGVSR